MEKEEPSSGYGLIPTLSLFYGHSNEGNNWFRDLIPVLDGNK